MRFLAVCMVAAMALTGCVDANQDDPAAAPTAPQTSAGGASAPGDAFTLDAPPVPALGTTWVYSASGVWDLSPEEVVIFAARDGDRLQFAGDAPQALWDDVIWGRAWHGQMTPELNPARERGPVLFDWPLHDGKTWASGDHTVEARVADVPGIDGQERGFRMRADAPGHVYEWTYAPSVGWLSSFTYGVPDGDVYERLVIEGIEQRSAAVWFEAGAYGGFGHAHGHPAAPAPDVAGETYTVDEGFDEVIVIALATPGGHGDIVPPDVPPEPWSFDGDGLWAWSTAALPATPGSWQVVHRVDGAEDWTSMEMRAVRWLDLAIEAES